MFVKSEKIPKLEDGRRKTGEKMLPEIRALFFLFFVIILITSCNRNKIFDEHYKLENYSWNRFEKITFDCTIEEAGNYDIYAAIRYVQGVPYRIIPAGLQIIFPNGEERYNDIELNIRNKDGSYKGAVAGDIWDCSVLVLKNYSISKEGKYTFVIHNMRSKLETPGIMEIGLIVEKSKED